MDLSDLFWSGGSTLSHLGEPWASDLPTREGIQFFLNLCSLQEELCRLACKAQQLTQWALEYQANIDSVNTQNVGGLDERHTITVCLHAGLQKEVCQLWFHWNADLVNAFRSTAIYLPSRDQLAHDQELVTQWKGLMEGLFGHWEPILTRVAVGEEEDYGIAAADEAEAEENCLMTSENFDMIEDDYCNT
ncbi:uncharacterized protein MELLADRAFT_113768 [Melampsora larici-populina 98AG31]|uniref:Uncharacterized protein n=1 Tax=Melampsora larici-populina (strain 98AG31 / pathotype 3-4-7) TaxID=747676 RepID=F4SB03_MELLP|nr:uncharacterized protein MELLADRAFT_113768 [Melampsora larici-populina 98AG31]EGF98175.1 hypothetical protein MELLADRAFT_113768 [Melampsora larici-populina 98AG31]